MTTGTGNGTNPGDPDTDRHNVGALAAGVPLQQPASGRNSIQQLAETLEELRNGGGGSGRVPKAVKRHNLTSIILALVSALGVAIGSYYATEARSKGNEKRSQGNEVRIDKNENDVRYIKGKIGDIKTKMDDNATQQTTILNGVEELKKENVNRLKRELRDVKRELRNR